MTSQDSPVSAAPAESQSNETCLDSEEDLAYAAAEEPHPDFVSV